MRVIARKVWSKLKGCVRTRGKLGEVTQSQRRWIAISLVVTMLLPVLMIQAFAAEEKMILNGEFESVLPTGAFEHWKSEPRESVLSAEENGISGRYAVILGKEEGVFLQSNFAPAAASGNYMLSFYIKRSGGALFAAKIHQRKESGVSDAGELLVDLDSDYEADSWSKVAYHFQCAADAAEIAVSFEGFGGKVSLDRVVLKKVSRAPRYTPEGEAVALDNPGFAAGLNGWDTVGDVSLAKGYFQKGIQLKPGEKGAGALQNGVILEPSCVYELHYYIKASDAAGLQSYVGLEQRNAQDLAVHKSTQENLLKPFILYGNSQGSGWQEVTAQFQTGENTKSAVLRLGCEPDTSAKTLSENASVVFDEISIVKKEGAKQEPLRMLFAPEAAVQISGETNYLTNGSFDSGTSGWTWSALNGAAATLVHDVPEDYDNALYISAPSTMASDTAQYGQPTQLEAGKTYTFTYWLKIQNPAVNSAFKIVICDSQNSAGQFPPQLQSASTNGVWKKFSANYTIPATHGNAFFRLQGARPASGTTEYFITGLSVTEEQPSGNLFPNGDFLIHDGTADFTMDKLGSTFGWGDGGAATARRNWEIISGTPHGNALKITNRTTGADIFQNTVNPLTVGKTYVFSYWIKTEGTVREVYPRIASTTGE